MGPMLRQTLFALVLLPAAASGQTVQLSYSAYAAGLNVVNMDAALALAPTSYRLRLVYRTAGTFGVFIRGQQDTTVEGQFANGRAQPQRFVSTGVMRGEPRMTVIDYVGGRPAIRQLTPPSEQEREPVPPDQQRGTIDTLSAMAELIRKVNDTGRCDGKAMTFDGRRLAELSARTVGLEFLGSTHLSSFTGAALHCEFDGRMLGGFKMEDDRESMQRPQHGNAWFAAVTPGGPMIPVRISFRTRWFGDAAMFITARD
ncbi:MAG: DUF3108 domain-containing protein [Acetobacteraceae bacterium]|nr:DUF3108 domain-containing protein [Acetobacteraceae bacterium]